MHGETREIIGAYMLERKKIIARARAKNPTALIPDALLIYERNGRLGAYQKTAVVEMLIGLRRRVEASTIGHLTSPIIFYAAAAD